MTGGGGIIKPKFAIADEIQQGIDRLTSILLPSQLLPDQTFCMFKRRKACKPTEFIKRAHEREVNLTETITNNILSKEVNRRYSKGYRTQVHISRNIMSLLKRHLNSDKKEFIDKMDKYIEINGLPERLTYDVIDFIHATGNKFKNLTPSQVLNLIGMHNKIKINAVLSGSAPKLGKTLYQTVPRLFSQLYYDVIENTAIILPDSKLESFEEHLFHWYNNELRRTTKALLNCQSSTELDNIIIRLQREMDNFFWVPKQIKGKVKQMEMYFRNKDFKKPELSRFLAHSYLKWQSDHGTNEDVVKNISPSEVLLGIKRGLENTLKTAKKRARVGWTVFESVTQKESCLYNELASVLKELGGKISPVSNTKTTIKTYKKCIMKKFMLVPKSEILFRQATS